MTKEEAIKWLKQIKNVGYQENLLNHSEALDMAIKALEVEPLTDTEQRIFLAAMRKEEKVCKEVCADGDGVDLVAVCHSIERKVKRVLWK